MIKHLECIDNCKIIERDTFLDDIYDCDIFVGDYCSTIIEAIVLNKKIIYTPTEVGYSEFGKKFLNASYIVNNVEDLNKTIEKLLQGDDPLKEERKRFFQIASPTPKNGTFSRDLLDYIATNYVPVPISSRTYNTQLDKQRIKHKISLKNKFLYKIWKHLDKKLRKKGIIP